MCYKKPGPRCAKVATERLRKARLSGDESRIREATQDYLLTPAGIKSLRKKGRTSQADQYQKQRDALIAQSSSGPQEDKSDHEAAKKGGYTPAKESYTEAEIMDIIRAKLRFGGHTPTEIKNMRLAPNMPLVAFFEAAAGKSPSITTTRQRNPGSPTGSALASPTKSGSVPASRW